MHLLVRSESPFKSLRIWEVSIGLMYRFAVWKSERKEKMERYNEKDI